MRTTIADKVAHWLRPVNIGASASDLIAQLGSPDRTSASRPVVLEWGSLRLGLDPTNDDTVQSICVRVVDGEFRLPRELPIEWDPLMTMRSKEHVDWHVQRQEVQVSQDHAIDLTKYTSDAGVTLHFGRDETLGPDSLIQLVMGSSDPCLA